MTQTNWLLGVVVRMCVVLAIALAAATGLVLARLTVVQAQGTAAPTFEAITVSATAGGFTATTIAPTGSPQKQVCFLRLETAEVRYRVDGATATSTSGTLLEVGETLRLTGYQQLTRLSAIRTTGTSGQLDATCSDTDILTIAVK